MASEPRIQFSGAIYHVNSRGNDGRDTFHDDHDRFNFLVDLANAVKKHEVVVHAFVLMSNHWHGLIETPHGNIAEAMHRVNWSYARRFNRRHGYRNHVFGTPYHDELVVSDGHFLEVVRYTVLNPVRAAICKLPEHYAWSSFRATAGLDPAPAFLTTRRILEQIDPRPEVARARYVSFVHEGIGLARPDASLCQVKGRGSRRRVSLAVTG